ncbi:MAG: hypothetical protein KH142_04870 [Slackia piriformis]|uniref:Uncharacterized protein n=1 Tax=Slackia piriformis TaxID=626934 RepID=A0A943V069_9ACTN|nr:hypothetical protein [Slackia piriformis]
MGAPAFFATFDDYAARYDAAEADAERVGVLLGDASAVVAASLPAGADIGALAPLLTSTVCAMVNRAFVASGMAGVSNYSEGAAGITASVTYANPSGDLYMTATEKAALGIGGGFVGVFDLTGGAR